MFRAKSPKDQRQAKVLEFLSSDPGISLLLAAVNFEWTASRAIRFLGQATTSELRPRLRRCHGLDDYKRLWKTEVVNAGRRERLTEIVCNWEAVRKAFEWRHLLVHGRDGCTSNIAKPHVEALLLAAGYVEDYAKSLGCPLNSRMRFRRKRRLSPANPPGG